MFEAAAAYSDNTEEVVMGAAVEIGTVVVLDGRVWTAIAGAIGVTAGVGTTGETGAGATGVTATVGTTVVGVTGVTAGVGTTVGTTGAGGFTTMAGGW